VPILTSMLPLAHIGHYLWVFYLLPVIFVVIGILRTTRAQKREDRDNATAGGAGEGPRTDKPARPQDPPP
jgi:hypothetical protein